MSAAETLRQLCAGAAALGVPLADADARRLLQLGDELLDWNRKVNLTALDTPAQVLTHHLLDSLSVAPLILGPRVADVGTGGGFPGLPLALVQPQHQFTLIDSVAKKLRFVDHAAQLLGLANVQTVHARVEALQVPAFDTVVTRAFAPLPRLLRWVAPLCDAHTCVLAMKGRWPPTPGSDDAGELPPGWQLQQVLPVTVPGLAAARHILRLSRRA